MSGGSINESVASREHEEQPLLEQAPSRAASLENHPIVDQDPMNQLSVRFYRYILLALLAVAFVWFAALVVDAYAYLGITAPQGPGIDVIGVLVLSIVSLFVALAFYRIPSKFDKTMGYLSAIFLLIDVVMLLSVPDLRHRTGVGIAVYAFALLAFAAGALSNAVVLSASPSKLDGRKTLFEWAEVFVFNVVRVALFASVLVVTTNLVIDAADSNLMPLGQLVKVQDLNIHVACTPAGEGPLVLVESGHSSSEETARWVIGSDNLGAVCYWDRPGRGYSDNAPSPFAIGDTVDILIEALDKARPGFRNESVVLVSHGVGALYSRVLAARLGKSVKGIMMVDGTHEELFYDTWAFFKSAWHFIVGAASPVRLGKIASVVGRGFTAEDRVYGRLERLGARYQKNLLQEFAQAGRQSRRDISDATLGLAPHIPLLVVSSSERCKDQQWSTYQRLLLKLSDNVLAWKIVEGPHQLWRNSKSQKELMTLLEGLAKYS